MRNTLLAVVLSIAAAATGVLVYRGMVGNGQAVDAAATQLIGMHLPDTKGNPRAFSVWRDQILVVNFWATWCEPCRDEVPTLLKVQSENAGKGVQMVGIAIDSAAKVQRFSEEFKITYPVLIGGAETMDLMRKLGNQAGGLPFTIIISRSGKVVATHLGRITEGQLVKALGLAST